MTSKLKLDVDALEVTSFDTGTAGGERGTVHGLSGTLIPTCRFTCNPGATCDCPISGQLTCA